MKKFDRFMTKFIKTATFISATLLIVDAGIKVGRKAQEVVRSRRQKKLEKTKAQVAAA